MGDALYSIDQLVDLLQVRKRTLTFWAEAELWEGPGAGRGALRYTDDHLGRLAFIAKLRDAQLSLAEIRKRLSHEKPSRLRALAEEAKASRRLRIEEGAQSTGAASGITPGETKPVSVRADSMGTAAASRTVWDRIPLAPGVELHVRRPQSDAATQALVNDLVALARRSSKEA